MEGGDKGGKKGDNAKLNSTQDETMSDEDDTLATQQ